MTFEQYRLRKWCLTVGVFLVSAIGLLITDDVESKDWAVIAVALVGAYALDKWVDNR